MHTSGPRTTGHPLSSQDCDLVTVPARQGLEAVDILRLRDGVGPVLHDGPCDTLGFLVPPGTADGWDLPGSACIQTCLQRPRDGGPAAGATWSGGTWQSYGTAPSYDAGQPPGPQVVTPVPGAARSARSAGSAAGPPPPEGRRGPEGFRAFDGLMAFEGGRSTVEPPVKGTGWLVPPDAAYASATDPVELRAALGEAARTIEAADRCQ